jgi:cytochrome P450
MLVDSLPDLATYPPGPSEPPFVQTLHWLTRPIAFMESARRRYGDAFSVRFSGFQRPTVMLSDPDVIRALYTEQSHTLPPGRSVALLPIMGPSSVLLLSGREHLTRRKAMLPPFHGERMRSYEGIVREVAQREIDSWPLGEPFALHPHMQAITLEVIMSAVFGVTDPERRQRLRERLPMLLGESSSLMLQFRVLLSRRFTRSEPLARLQQVMQEVDELLLAEISERRRDSQLEEREDILSLLMAVRMEDGEGMSDRDLRDQLVTLLLAGHETTATALAWTFDLLLRHPATLTRLTEEIDRGESEEYMRAVIAESLRLRPVVPLAGRRLAAELDIGSTTLAPGTDVTPAIWLTHTRADLYPEPYAFRPERFLGDPPTTYGWIPFGGGIRRCLGASFAEFEMRVVLQAMLQRLQVQALSSRAEHVARRNVTFSPRYGTRVRVRERVRANSAANTPTPIALANNS